MVLQESNILSSCVLLPTRVLFSSLRSKPGQEHILCPGLWESERECQGNPFLNQVRQSSIHIFYFYSIGENLIAWPHLAAREAGNVIFTWVTLCPEGKEKWIQRSNQQCKSIYCLPGIPDSMVTVVIKKTYLLISESLDSRRKENNGTTTYMEAGRNPNYIQGSVL